MIIFILLSIVFTMQTTAKSTFETFKEIKQKIADYDDWFPFKILFSVITIILLILSVLIDELADIQ